ncbi:hypothetical protein COO91_05069 [Nostoc flagelliforme CCNUN1]|uniref:Uncharacterized protein n=1 Tax=Nostoc flagelliforme CCNUN1 TaxID=2038116 RepID=A0A2K8SUG2_9NOSO|nr:hypothetical protein COO91_05069 [Nostoc flagelliforme CCNUN1]
MPVVALLFIQRQVKLGLWWVLRWENLRVQRTEQVSSSFNDL